MKRLLAIGAILSGLILFLCGLFFSVLYVMEAIVKRLGEADQSPLFWYLPILIIGLGGILFGGFILFWGKKRLRAMTPDE